MYFGLDHHFRCIHVQTGRCTTRSGIFLVIVRLATHLNTRTAAAKEHTAAIIHDFREETGRNVVSLPNGFTEIASCIHQQGNQVQQHQHKAHSGYVGQGHNDQKRKHNLVVGQTNLHISIPLTLPIQLEAGEQLGQEDRDTAKGHPKGCLCHDIATGTQGVPPSSIRGAQGIAFEKLVVVMRALFHFACPRLGWLFHRGLAVFTTGYSMGRGRNVAVLVMIKARCVFVFLLGWFGRQRNTARVVILVLRRMGASTTTSRMSFFYGKSCKVFGMRNFKFLALLNTSLGNSHGICFVFNFDIEFKTFGQCLGGHDYDGPNRWQHVWRDLKRLIVYSLVVSNCG